MGLPQTCTSIHLILWRKKGVVKYKNPPEFRSHGFPRVKKFIDKPMARRLKGRLCEKKYEPWRDPIQEMVACGRVCEHPGHFCMSGKSKLL
jgi:hypothetical protein